jgi:hemoglobin
MGPMADPGSMYERVGGAPWFAALVDRFYEGVAADPVLRPMYPADLTESKRTLTLFLIQYWGGPTDYSDERGHPRLRMRHAPFTVDRRARAAWLQHMTDAVRSGGLSGLDEARVLGYFTQASDAMRNVDEPETEAPAT